MKTAADLITDIERFNAYPREEVFETSKYFCGSLVCETQNNQERDQLKAIYRHPRLIQIFALHSNNFASSVVINAETDRVVCVYFKKKNT